MKIFIGQYLNPHFGNCSTEQIEIPSNKITVSALKQILYEKYQIPPSDQKLTVKTANLYLITMTDEWPLSFFYIRTNSKIYLEKIKPYNKAEEIISSTKSKYLKSLGLYNSLHNNGINEFSNVQLNKDKKEVKTNLCTIFESPNEYNDELFIRKRTSSRKQLSNNSSIENVKEIILMAIKNNNLIQLQEIFDQYNHDYIKNINEPLTESNGWNPLHYACFYGYVDIANYLIHSLNANVNYVNKEGFTPLHLAVFKSQKEIIKLLICVNGIDINCYSNIYGTPLHIACKKKCLQTVSLLLVPKADVYIKDKDGKIPLEVCSDGTIKKLLSKIMHNNSKLSSTSSTKTTSSTFSKDFPFLKNIDFKPPKPPKALGYVEKIGNFIPIYRIRFLEVDPLLGAIKRYKCYEDYPRNPNKIIPLTGILSCVREYGDYEEKEDPNDKPNYYYFSIMYNSKEIYRVQNKEASKKWIEVINSSVIYAKFWNKWSIEFPSTTDYLLKQSKEIIIINQNTGECKKYQRNKELKSSKIKANLKTPIKRIASNYLIDDSRITQGLTYDSFEILDILGSGTFGKVFKVCLKHAPDKGVYAMKVINKRYLLRNNQLKYAITECNVLKQTNTPFIVRLHYAFQTMENLYMILDYCPGGDLAYHLMFHLFEESEAKFYIGELILAIEHLHNLDIIYRDLKPENILIDNENHIKLADFGLAKENVQEGQITKSFCGSPAYLSPEMLNRKGVGKSADVYGIGAVLYEMISGTPPFYSNDIGLLYQNIQKSKLVLHNYFSPELKDLLKKLLCKEPKHRIGIHNKDEIKSHPFFRDVNWDKLANKQYEPPLNLVQIKSDKDNNKKSKKDGVEAYIKSKQLKFKDVDYNSGNQNIRRVKNFTFLNESDKCN